MLHKTYGEFCSILFCEVVSISLKGFGIDWYGDTVEHMSQGLCPLASDITNRHVTFHLQKTKLVFFLLIGLGSKLRVRVRLRVRVGFELESGIGSGLG